MYSGLSMSVPSLHRESTDSLILMCYSPMSEYNIRIPLFHSRLECVVQLGRGVSLLSEARLERLLIDCTVEGGEIPEGSMRGAHSGSWEGYIGVGGHRWR